MEVKSQPFHNLPKQNLIKEDRMMRQSINKPRPCFVWNRLSALLLAIAVATVAGCGNNGDPRQHNLSGTVTFAGKPIPAGSIVFEPDSAKGNSGPQGAADIRDGKYDTKATGKGTLGGPYIVRITGFDRLEENESQPATRLFDEYRIEVDISEKTDVKDFDVPADVPNTSGSFGGNVTDI